MKSEKLTNTLLALIFLALVANVAIPLLRADEASAAGRDSAIPSDVAANAGLPALDKIAADVTNGLDAIADSNLQIARAIEDSARTSERIADSLQDVAAQVKGISLTAPVPPARRAPGSERPSEEKEELNPDWWKNYIDE